MARRLLIGLASLGTVALVFISMSRAVDRWNQKNQVEEEIRALEREAHLLREENATLGEKISYFGSDAFREREAKEKLNMKYPEEEVVIVTPDATEKNLVISEGEFGKNQQASFREPNYLKWWKLLLSPEER